MSKPIIFLCVVLFASRANCWDFLGVNLGDPFALAKTVGKGFNDVVTNAIKAPATATQELVEHMKKATPLVQELEKYVASQAANPATKDSAEQLKKLINPISELVKNFDSTKTGTDLLKPLNSFQTDYNKAVEELAKVKADAAAKGVNTTECDGLNEHVAREAHAVITKLADCLTEKVTDLSKTMTQITNGTEHLVNNLADKAEAALHCTVTAPLSVLQCTANAVIGGATETIIGIPSVGVNAGKLGFSVLAFAPSISMCASMTAFEGFFRTAVPAINQSIKCVQSKIAGK